MKHKNIVTDNREKVVGQIAELMNTQRFAVLSTQQNNQPYASLVAFAVSTDLKHVYFLTPNTTRKYENLTANPKVAVLVNDSRNQAEDIENAASVTGTGVAHVVVNGENQAALDDYLQRHPHLKAFAAAPTTAFISITMNRYFMVNRFQNVVVVKIE